MVIGANVMDHADDEDADASNDGRRGYGSDGARATLDRLKRLGLNGVVLPVEIHAKDLTSTSVRASQLSSAAGLPRLGRMITDAKARGFSVVVVPHLLLDDDSWRGEIQHRGDARRAFFQQYTQAILPIAQVAERSCADAFSIAIELRALTADKTSTPFFSSLIRDVRGAFTGGLTYSANWDEAETVRFWDQLDGIGVNAFFPLAPNAAAPQTTLETHATEAQAKLLALRQRLGKPLWMLEVGFKAVHGSFVEPWLWPAEVAGKHPTLDEESQRRGYAAVATAVRRVPAASGMFFWAVPSDPGDRKHAYRFEPEWGFSFLGKAAESEVKALAANPPPR